ncbi:hypothetical protein A3B21_02670 [Candidatus Uhrbacteria bacterium RIFCSPLOWO2_01_FULL_47_24]|uniref:DNA primase/polymerase bifunctional N-terminal domain-containing protein n=1 Tax=Candidatus Uhrbacteria bacterium RIFCSPLOWO2_01_FULL_47_24 TaxID=1802401 RepID=A0A1F7UTY5_9BACT|nr:MAG: hypothetical protein A3B21_02670 [Candidatus Uhrbacteria bacterium RIFCSPLOWO2_01_FULL_47_24]OGL84667.1 MAG: hypothetical protein A3J03_02590 [Candidatus Uhrbacteria bacterium RIFCSPLOWO2_02_FULL_46_25]
MKMNMSQNLLKYALEYLQKGWSVFPVGKDKKPLLTEWKPFQTRKATEEEAREWWKIWPDANIGIVTGKISGITVVDVEVGGKIEGLPSTYTVKTGNGGWHFYYQHAEIGNKTRTRELTDIRGDGGFVVAPPSVTDYINKTGLRKGGAYELVADSDLAEFPIDLLPKGQEYASPLNPADYAGISEGSRNDKLHALACSVVQRFPEKQAWHFIQLTNEGYRPPLPAGEVRAIFQSALRLKIQKRERVGKRTALIRRLSDIQPEEIQWLWPERIALGKLTLLSGDPGLGKSLLTTTLAAYISKGFLWPIDKAEAPVGDVLLLSAEDDAADTIRPRLDAAQANCDKIHVLESIQEVNAEGETTRTMFSFRKDLQAIEELLQSLPACKLVAIDPVSAYLDGTDSHKNADIRALLAPLADLAARHNVAVVMVSHLNKNSGGNAMYRTMGTLAFVAAVRAAYIVTKDQENPARRLFMPVKNNLAKDIGGLAYSIITAENGAPVIVWESEPVSITADEALAIPEQNEEHTATDEAIDFLRELLANGEMEATEVKKEAKQAGINDKPLRRAREKMGIKPKKADFSGGWKWALPSYEDAQSAQDARTKERAPSAGRGPLGERSGDGLLKMVNEHLDPNAKYID